MMFLRFALLNALLVIAILRPAGAIQASSGGDVFTLAVAPPTLAKDVQVRYYLAGERGGQAASVTQPGITEPGVDNTVRVLTEGSQGQGEKSLKLIAYAPGCQFMTFTVDLGAGPGRGDFHCHALPTIPLHGRLDILDFGPRELQIEVLYDCGWAMSFFGVVDGAVSPLSLGKVHVASDGTFTMDVPDFASDASWPNMSGNAGLRFALLEGETGTRLAMLTPLADHSHNGDAVPVASSYPELVFAAQQPR